MKSPTKPYPNRCSQFMKTLVLIMSLMISLPGFGQIRKLHKINLEVNTENRILWSMAEMASKDTLLTFSINSKKESNTLEGIPTGTYRFRLRNVFNDFYDTIVKFDKRIGVTLKLNDLDNSYLPSGDRLITSMMDKDTLFVFYDLHSGWDRVSGNLAIVRIDREFLGIRYNPGTLVETAKRKLTKDEFNHIGQIDYMLSRYCRKGDTEFYGIYFLELNNEIIKCENGRDKTTNFLEQLLNDVD